MKRRPYHSSYISTLLFLDFDSLVGAGVPLPQHCWPHPRGFQVYWTVPVLGCPVFQDLMHHWPAASKRYHFGGKGELRNSLHSSLMDVCHQSFGNFIRGLQSEFLRAFSTLRVTLFVVHCLEICCVRHLKLLLVWQLPPHSVSDYWQGVKKPLNIFPHYSQDHTSRESTDTLVILRLAMCSLNSTDS